MALRDSGRQLPPWLARLRSVRFELAAIGLGAIAVYFTLANQLETGVDRTTLGLLFWGAIIYLVWQKQSRLRLESDALSTLLGLLLLGLFLVKSATLFWFESAFLHVAPLLVGLSVGLLASGWRGLAQYWRESIVVLLLSIPAEYYINSLFGRAVPFQETIVSIATFVLWYLGFEPTRQGNTIQLPDGAVEVTYACTGTDAAAMLLKLAIVFALVFRLSWKQRALVAAAAPLIGFGSGAIRVAVMAHLVSDAEAFWYWHGAAGNAFFSTAAILAFGALCQFIVSRNQQAQDA